MSKEKQKADWNVEAESLANEIAVAIGDLFEGAIKTDGAAITVNFINGQNFKIFVEEVK